MQRALAALTRAGLTWAAPMQRAAPTRARTGALAFDAGRPISDITTTTVPTPAMPMAGSCQRGRAEGLIDAA